MIVFCGKCFAALWLGSVAIHRKTQLQNFSLYRHGAGTGGRSPGLLFRATILRKCCGQAWPAAM